MEAKNTRAGASLLLACLALVISIAALVVSLGRDDGDDTSALTERLTVAEDKLAIRRLLVDYAATQDARDYAAYADLFASDGEWVNGDLVYEGPEDIQQMLVDLYGEPPEDYVNTENFHITYNPRIDVDGDRATATSRHLLIMRGEGGQPIPRLAGRYEDELVREDGEWKFQRRVDHPIMPTPEEWRAFIRARQSEQ